MNSDTIKCKKHKPLGYCFQIKNKINKNIRDKVHLNCTQLKVHPKIDIFQNKIENSLLRCVLYVHVFLEKEELVSMFRSE